MNAVLEQINSIGKASVEFAVPMLVQSSVLIVILLLLDLALRKKVKAVFRYCIWMLVLVKLILPTSLSSPLSLGYWFGDKLAYVAESRTTAAPEAEVVEPALADMLHIIEPVPIEVERHTPAVSPIMPDVEPAVTEPVGPPVTWQGIVFLVWLAVVIALGLLLLQRAMFVRGLVAQAKDANALMNGALEYCCKCMGVKRKIGLKVSANATSPAVCGLFRPVILLPHKLAPSLGSRGLRAVLLHELAHIRRGDLWVNLVQTVLQIMYFYNPLLWLANAMIRRVREQAIDETVLVAMGEKAQQYPQTLVNVAKLAFKRPVLSLRLIGVVESKSALAGRIKHILNRPMPKSAKLGILGLAAVVIVGAVLLPMAKAEKTDVQISGRDLVAKIIESERKIRDIQLHMTCTIPAHNRTFYEYDWGYDDTKEFLSGTTNTKDSRTGAYRSVKLIRAFDGKREWLFRNDPKSSRPSGGITKPNPNFSFSGGMMTFNTLLGFDAKELSRLSLGQAIAQAESVSVKEQIEFIDGRPCYVIKAINLETDPSVHWAYDVRAWIDYQRDYRPLRFEKYRSISGKNRFKVVSRRVDNIKLEQIDGIWLPIQGERTTFSTNVIRPPKWMTRAQFAALPTEEREQVGVFKLTPMVPTRRLEIDVESIRLNKGISPEAFTIDFPKGCEVYDEFTGNRYIVGEQSEKDAALSDAELIEQTKKLSVSELIDVLRSKSLGLSKRRWFAVIHRLVEIGSPAVPQLVAEIRKTDKPRTQSKLALTLRAIGDLSAVPGLVDGLERSGFSSDYGIGEPKTELDIFFKRHQMDPAKEGLGLGRPVREITIALERLTGHTEGHDHFHAYDSKGKQLGSYIVTPEIRDRQREHRRQVAERWRKWWQENKDKVDLAKLAKVQPQEIPAPKEAKTPRKRDYGIIAAPEGAMLTLAIVPNVDKPWRQPILTKEEYQWYLDDLAHNGPFAGSGRGDSFQWSPIKGDAKNYKGLPLSAYKERTYILLCARAQYVMIPEVEGKRIWGIEAVEVIRDMQGRDAISVRFDEKGAELLAKLTKANIDNHLALAVDGWVRLASVIQAPLKEAAFITGDFPAGEVRTLVEDLKKGMPVVDQQAITVMQQIAESAEKLNKDDLAKMGPRQVVENLFVVGLSGNAEKLTWFFRPGSVADGVFSVRDFAQMADGQKIKVLEVYADSNDALAITSNIKGKSGDQEGQLIFYLSKQTGTWLIYDGDAGDSEKAHENVDEFLITHPDVEVEEAAEFKATLSNGVTVELVGVCDHPSEGKQWWRPDGSSLKNSPYDDDFGRAFPKDGEKGYKFAVKYSGMAGRDIDARVIPLNFKTTNGGALFSTSKKNGKENMKYLDGSLDEKIVWLGAAFDEELGNCDIRIGVCFGDWKENYRYETDQSNDVVEWVTFKNVSLKPNFKTDVQVEGETTYAGGLRCNAELIKNELAFGQDPELAVSLTNTTTEPIDVIGYCRNSHSDRYLLPCALTISPVGSKHYRISNYDFIRNARHEAIRIAPGRSWSFRIPPPKTKESTTAEEHRSSLPSLRAWPPGKYTAQVTYFIRESEIEKFGSKLYFGPEMGDLSGKKPDRIWQGVVQSKELVFEVLDDNSEQLRIRKAIDSGEGIEKHLQLELKASKTKVLLSVFAKNTGEKTLYLGGHYCLRGKGMGNTSLFGSGPMELKPGVTLELGGWNLRSIGPGTYWVEYLSNFSPERVLKKSNTVTFGVTKPAVQVEGGTTNEADEVRYEGRTIEQWISQFDSESYDDRRKAIGALTQIGRPVVPAMIEEMKKGGMRASCARGVLGKMGPEAEDVVPWLIKVALDKDVRIGKGWESKASYRENVVSCLNYMTWARDQAIPVLQRIAEDDEDDTRLRRVAVLFLRDIGKEAIPILRKVTEAEERSVRDAAHGALGQLLEKEEGLSKDDYYTPLIEKDPFDASVPSYLAVMKSPGNLGRPHPLTQKIKRLYRQRLGEEPNAQLAWQLVAIIQYGLRNTELTWAAPTDSSKVRWPREDPTENFATLAEVLQVGFDHAESGSQLWHQFGISLAKLRLLQGDWDEMNAMLKELGQEPIPKQSRRWLPAPPVDWRKGLSSRWVAADESMRSGNCSLEFRIEKDGKGLKGAHFLVKRAPEPTNVTNTGISIDTLFFQPYPLAWRYSFGYMAKDRPMTRYAVSDESGIVRFEKLPNIPIKIEVLVPTANFAEAASRWELWMEVEPGKFKIAKVYGAPEEVVNVRKPPAVVELKEGETVHYPRLVVRPAFGRPSLKVERLEARATHGTDVQVEPENAAEFESHLQKTLRKIAPELLSQENLNDSSIPAREGVKTIQQRGRPDRTIAVREEKKDIDVTVRGVISGYDQLTAILDVDGELFAAPSDTELILKPFDKTCVISSIDQMSRTVVLKYSNKEISLPFTGEPTPNWKIPNNGLSASLEPLKTKYEYDSKIMVRFTLQNISDREITVDLGRGKSKPYFWFFMTYSRFGEPSKLPKHIFSRKWDFKYFKQPLRPRTLAPREKITLEFDLNRFLEHQVGTPEAMGSIPIGRAHAWYNVVGIYQQLGNVGENVWSGALTTNSISFRVLPKKEIATEFYRIDQDGIHWDYEALSKAAESSRSRANLNLMIEARAVHLVPQIIDKIHHGGSKGVGECVKTIIALTGHDFSKDFGIKGIWQHAHAAKIKLLLREWWKKHGEKVVKERGAIKEWKVPKHWEKELAKMSQLHWAVIEGDTNKVQKLLTQGADISAKSEDNWTALHWAAFMGHTDIAKLLYAHDADINARDKYNSTPLDCAVLMNHSNLVKLLKQWAGYLDDDSKTYFVGEFKMGRQSAVDLTLDTNVRVCLETKDGAVWSQIITFQNVKGNLQTILRVVYTMKRPFKWRTIVELLDVEGQIIVKDETVSQNGATENHKRKRASSDLRFSLGKWPQVSHAKRFRVIFEPEVQVEGEKTESPVWITLLPRSPIRTLAD